MRGRNHRGGSPYAWEGQKSNDTIAKARNSLVVRAAYGVAVGDSAGCEVPPPRRLGRQGGCSSDGQSPQSHLLIKRDGILLLAKTVDALAQAA
jgi:hypothetical protein